MNIAELIRRIDDLESRIEELESKKRGKRFVPPTVEEVRAHCIEKGYTFDPETFVSHYESNDWKVSRNKMKSWHAACVTWQKRQRNETSGSNNRNAGAVGNVASAIDQRAKQRADSIQS